MNIPPDLYPYVFPNGPGPDPKVSWAGHKVTGGEANPPARLNGRADDFIGRVFQRCREIAEKADGDPRPAIRKELEIARAVFLEEYGCPIENLAVHLESGEVIR